MYIKGDWFVQRDTCKMISSMFGVNRTRITKVHPWYKSGQCASGRLFCQQYFTEEEQATVTRFSLYFETYWLDFFIRENNLGDTALSTLLKKLKQKIRADTSPPEFVPDFLCYRHQI